MGCRASQCCCPGEDEEGLQRLENRVADLELFWACRVNTPFVFLLPSANTQAVRAEVQEAFRKFGVAVTACGAIAAENVEEHRRIDRHHGLIAEAAVIAAPCESIRLCEERAVQKFAQLFGISWNAALAAGSVLNAQEACSRLGLAPAELASRWDCLEKGRDHLQLRSGVYVGRIDNVYVINGFYLRTRAQFTKPGTSIFYFKTEFDATRMSWKQFTQNVIGDNFPGEASSGSVRRMISERWQQLGLPAKLGRRETDGVLHASASPFEALVERRIWLDEAVEQDTFGKALLASGVSLERIEAWCHDPVIRYEGRLLSPRRPEGLNDPVSAFDAFEGLDSRECITKALLMQREHELLQNEKIAP